MPQDRFYTIESGDTLAVIAAQLGVTVQSIIDLNQIENPDTIAAGQVIEIIGVGRDITERKKSEDAIKEINRKLNLLSSITRHDILNQITGLVINNSVRRQL